jgi:hypothetical protein
MVGMDDCAMGTKTPIDVSEIAQDSIRFRSRPPGEANPNRMR